MKKILPLAILALIMGGHPSLAEEPQSGKAWKPVKANALILAENGNLLTFRGPKGDDATEWIALATELREQGRRVYQAAKKRNYPQARAAMKSFTESCNACHHRFADGEHLQSP